LIISFARILSLWAGQNLYGFPGRHVCALIRLAIIIRLGSIPKVYMINSGAVFRDGMVSYCMARMADMGRGTADIDILYTRAKDCLGEAEDFGPVGHFRTELGLRPIGLEPIGPIGARDPLRCLGQGPVWTALYWTCCT
jgi:hypothetical protein